MANFCNYSVKVKGTPESCEAFYNTLPVLGDSLRIENEEEYAAGIISWIIVGSCKNSLDCYATAYQEVEKLSEDEIRLICSDKDYGKEKYDSYSSIDKSRLFDVEVWTCEAREEMDDENDVHFSHYNKGSQAKDNEDVEVFEEIANPIRRMFLDEAVKVKFIDGKSYLYSGSYEKGSIVTVSGAKAGMIGMVVENRFGKSNRLYPVTKVLAEIDFLNSDHLQSLWNSFSEEEQKTFIRKCGKKGNSYDTFNNLALRLWIERGYYKQSSWSDFLNWLGKRVAGAVFSMPKEIQDDLDRQELLRQEKTKRELEEEKRKAEKKASQKEESLYIKEVLKRKKEEFDKRRKFFEKKYGKLRPRISNGTDYVKLRINKDERLSGVLHVGIVLFLLNEDSKVSVYLLNEKNDPIFLLNTIKFDHLKQIDSCNGRVGYLQEEEDSFLIYAEIEDKNDRVRELQKGIEEQLKQKELSKEELIWESRLDEIKKRNKEREELKAEKAKKNKIEREAYQNRIVEKLPIGDPKIQNKLDRLFERLEVYYPEHAVFALDAINQGIREDSTALAKSIGYKDYYDMFKAYDWKTLQGEEVKEIRNTVIYTPGNEPDFIKTRVNNTVENLGIYYPSHIIDGSIQNEHSNIASTISGLYQWFGYDSIGDFLKAYGFEYKAKATGRPSTVDPGAIIAQIRENNNNIPYHSMNELREKNKELSGKIKTLGNKSMEFFGMPLKKYLIKEGIIKK